jgi:DNA-binding NarL/FixJ family response regulator
MRKNILIAVDRAILRTGLRAIFRDDPSVDKLEEVTTAEELCKYLADSLPDLLVIHQSLVTNFNLLPKGRFLLLAFEASKEQISMAHAAGARGYFSENASGELLRMALHLADRDFLLDPAFTAQLLQASCVDALLSESPEGLTDRELEVFSLLRTGLTNRAIADRLSISESTVKTHVAHILQKLDLKRRQATVLSMFKNGTSRKR